MAIDADVIDAKVESAIAAMDAGQWSTAQTRLMSAKAMMAAMPDSSQGSMSVRYNAAAIDNLIAQCASRGSAASGVQRSKIIYRNANC